MLQNKRRKTNGVKKEDDDDDDVPLARRGKRSPAAVKVKDEPDSDSDVPLAAVKQSKEKAQIQRQAAAAAQKIRADEKKRKNGVKEEPESDSDVPLNAKRTKKANGVKKEESSDDDVPLAKRKAVSAKKAAPAQAAPAKGKGRVKKEVKEETPGSAEAGEEGEEEYQWWETMQENDGTQKWTTLEHNGVLFPPPYEPLPKNVKMKYDGKEIVLEPEAEEVAGFFGAMLTTQHAENPRFQENFFKDFQEAVKTTGGAKTTDGKVSSLVGTRNTVKLTPCRKSRLPASTSATSGPCTTTTR